MSRITKLLIFIVAFTASAALVRAGLDASSKRKAFSQAGQALDQLKQEATKKHPNLAASDAIQREAVAQVSEKLAAESNHKKRLETAAGSFLGFYLVNVRERDEFCRTRGVDISPFITAFQRGHAGELQKARAALANTPISEDEISKNLKPQLTQVIAQDMQDIAAQNKTSVKGACELVSASGANLAAEMHLSKVQPAVHQVLTNGR